MAAAAQLRGHAGAGARRRCDHRDRRPGARSALQVGRRGEGRAGAVRAECRFRRRPAARTASRADLSGTTLKRDKLQLAAQAISQAQVDADEADLKSKQALVAQQALVDKKTIRAPFAGKLGITAVNPGQYLNPGDKLVTLQTIDTVYVDFLCRKAAGQPVHRPEAEPDQRRLSRRGIPGQGDVHQSESGCRHPQRAGAGHRANAKRQLLPGMFANVSLDQGD
jgi:membrane fusion protein (multidrug efflux system)